MFYHSYVSLCNKRNISPSAAAEEMGFHRSDVTRWSKGAQPRQATIQKVADYFSVSVQDLMGEEKAPTPEGERQPSDEEIKFALFGGGGEITDAMFNEVKNFAAYVKQREEEKKKRG